MCFCEPNDENPLFGGLWMVIEVYMRIGVERIEFEVDWECFEWFLVVLKMG